MYNVIAPIAITDILSTTGAGANIEEAPDITEQIKNASSNSALEIMGRNGAKNLIPFDLDAIKALNVNGTWADNVYTYRGVDFTVNSDGSILADGQATGGNASIKLFEGKADSPLIGRSLILSGSPAGGSASTYRQQAYRVGSADGSTGTYFDDGAGSEAFTYLNNASGTKASVAVAIYENYDADNLLFHPMLRDSEDTDDTYQPPAKTNAELTAENQTLTQKIGTTTTKTLAANATSIEFDVPTTGDNLIEFFSSDGSNYTAIDTSVSGKVTLTYDAVASARTISCRVASA